VTWDSWIAFCCGCPEHVDLRDRHGDNVDEAHIGFPSKLGRIFSKGGQDGTPVTYHKTVHWKGDGQRSCYSGQVNYCCARCDNTNAPAHYSGTDNWQCDTHQACEQEVETKAAVYRRGYMVKPAKYGPCPNVRDSRRLNLSIVHLLIRVAQLVAVDPSGRRYCTRISNTTGETVLHHPQTATSRPSPSPPR
jgi:hypothetical protein